VYPPYPVTVCVTIRRPSQRGSTPSPAATTSPETVAPGTYGGSGNGGPGVTPLRNCVWTKSVGATATSTTTCPGPGTGSGTRAPTSISGPPNSLTWIARTK
jgi:hypothetical protein